MSFHRRHGERAHRRKERDDCSGAVHRVPMHAQSQQRTSHGDDAGGEEERLPEREQAWAADQLRRDPHGCDVRRRLQVEPVPVLRHLVDADRVGGHETRPERGEPHEHRQPHQDRGHDGSAGRNTGPPAPRRRRDRFQRRGWKCGREGLHGGGCCGRRVEPRLHGIGSCSCGCCMSRAGNANVTPERRSRANIRPGNM